MRKLVAAGILVLLIAACGPVSPTATPPVDVSMIQTQAAQDFAATLTAEASSPTPTSTPTVPRIRTPLPPTVTPVPSTPTSTPVPPTPTLELATPTATAIAATPTPKPIFKAEFIKPHYNCWVGCAGPPGERVYGYRVFQVDLMITNLTSDRTIVGWEKKGDYYHWGPSRWIITDGTNTREDTRWWEWVSRYEREFYEQPIVGPGETQVGTFIAFPIGRYEWVQAVEFELWGQVYRQEFDLGPLRNNYNYRDCGEEWAWKKECESK